MNMSMQDLLDEEVVLLNSGKDATVVENKIRELRGPAPHCFGDDDCSSKLRGRISHDLSY